MIYKENNIFHTDHSEKGIYDTVHSKRETLVQSGKISLEAFQSTLKEVLQAQSQVIKGLLDGTDEKNIQGDRHEIEIQLTTKNKLLIRTFLESLGILYVYENEHDEEKIKTGIDILSPDNKNTDAYNLKIIIKRRSAIEPFYIEKIDISK